MSSLNDAIRQLQNIKNDDCFMLLKENCVHVSTETYLVFITNEENLQLIVK